MSSSDQELDDLEREYDATYTNEIAEKEPEMADTDFPESSLFGAHSRHRTNLASPRHANSPMGARRRRHEQDELSEPTALAFAEDSDDEAEKRAFEDADSDAEMTESPAKKADETEELSKELQDADLEESKPSKKDAYKFAEEGEFEFDEAFDYAYDMPDESEEEESEEPLDYEVDFRAFEFATEETQDESEAESEDEEESMKSYTKYVIVEELSEDETAATYADKLEDKEDIFAENKSDAFLFMEELTFSEKLPKSQEEFQSEAFEYMQELSQELEADADTFEAEANKFDALKAAKQFDEEDESDQNMEDEEEQAQPEASPEPSKAEQLSELQQETPMIVG